MKTEGTVRSGGWQCSGYSLCVPGKIKIFPPYLRARLAESKVPQTREPFPSCCSWRRGSECKSWCFCAIPLSEECCFWNAESVWRDPSAPVSHGRACHRMPSQSTACEWQTLHTALANCRPANVKHEHEAWIVLSKKANTSCPASNCFTSVCVL